ncbi:MAG TPA: hypothetical protein VGG25_02615 [Streptosporangiaceae bacterium]|jgi:hypothetical protein
MAEELTPESVFRLGVAGAAERYSCLVSQDLIARYGNGEDRVPLSVAERLEILAIRQMMIDYFELFNCDFSAAVEAGATVEQVAAATKRSPAAVREECRDWARGAHSLHQRGLKSCAYADEAWLARMLARVADPEPGVDGDQANDVVAS